MCEFFLQLRASGRAGGTPQWKIFPLSVARGHVHTKATSTTDVTNDNVINLGTPNVRSVLAAALAFEASPATCKSFLKRISMIKVHKSNLAMLAFKVA